MFLITTIVFGWMALRPASSPIKTTATRQAATKVTDSDIVNVATRFATNLVTFNYTRPQDFHNRLFKDVTPGFATNYHPKLGGDIDHFVASVKANKAVSSGVVRVADVTAQEKDTATVLIVVGRTTKTTKRAEHTTFDLMELTMLQTRSGWKVDIVAAPSLKD